MEAYQRANLARLRHQHLGITGMLAAFSHASDVLKEEFIEGKWSVHENLAHLAHYEEVFLTRLELVVNSDTAPVFEVYQPDTAPVFLAYKALPTDKLLMIFLKNRKKIIQFYKELDDKQAAKTGQHLRYGTMNVHGLMELFLLHEAHHFFTMFGLLATLQAVLTE